MRTLLACLVAVTATAAATAAPIPTLYSTGVDASGVPLGSGVDPHYTVTGGGGGPFAVTNSIVNAIWTPNTATSQWISPATDTRAGAGPFTYTTTFDLTGFNPATASISGRWSADNEAQMFLNGVSVASLFAFNSPWQSLSPFSINAGFVSGVNTLTFVVPNGSGAGDGPTGLQVQLAGTADVAQITPEPVSLVVFGGLLVGGAGVALRRRMKKAVA